MMERPDSEFADDNLLERGDVKFRVNTRIPDIKIIFFFLGKMVQLSRRGIEENNDLLQRENSRINQKI